MTGKNTGLSDKHIQYAMPQAKDYKLYDRDGLRMLIRTSGTKVWQFNYQYRGKHKTLTIGRYLGRGTPGHVGLKEARYATHEARALLNQGIDPKEHNDKEQEIASGSETFEFIAREWHGKGIWADKHAKSILRSLERDVFPTIGDKNLSEINARDIIALIDSILERDATDVAKRICQRCEAIFEYAILKGICDNNPAMGRSKYIRPKPVQHRPHLSEAEFPEFLAKLETYHGRPYIKLAMKLLVITFVRPGELRQAKWEEFDLENAIWSIPAERMKMRKGHKVPLSKQALELLSEIAKVTRKSDFVFPSVQGANKCISDVTLLKCLKILGYEGDKKITPHGFRHTASTILNEHRFDKDIIERQLAHTDKNKVRAVYNHAEYIDERREMMQWNADFIDEQRAKGAESQDS